MSHASTNDRARAHGRASHFEGRWRALGSIPARLAGALLLRTLSTSYLRQFVDNFYLDQEPRALARRVVRNALIRRYYAASEAGMQDANRRLYWGARAGVNWNEDRRVRFGNPRLYKEEFLQSRRLLIEHIERICKTLPAVEVVCEVGTGNGLFVDHLSRRLPEVERFVGLDLSDEQIRINRRALAGTVVEFECTEIADYGARHGTPMTLFIACGAFECMSESELGNVLARLGGSMNQAILAFCDAVDFDYDPEVELHSRPRGHLLFNHNYRLLIEERGWRVHSYQVERARHHNRLTVVACNFQLDR